MKQIKPDFKRVKYSDFWLIGMMIILMFIGLVMIYSASSGQLALAKESPTTYLRKQAGWMAMSLVIFVIASYRPQNFRGRFPLNFLLVICLTALQLGLDLIGPRINGAAGWVALGPISFQPAEFLKLINVIYFAEVLLGKSKNMKWLTLGIFVMQMIAILAAPDLGGLAINLMIYLVMLIAALKIIFRWRFMWGVIPMIIMIYIATYIASVKKFVPFIPAYQAERIKNFTNPFDYVQTSGRQLVHSYYAISNGGWTGVGIGNSIEKQGYLPEPYTDFILSIISEEWGVIGVSLILLLLAGLICRIIILGSRTRSLYNTLVCYGIATFIFTGAVFNIGGMLGMLPLTGVTLPFISYGGSSLFVLTLSLGIVNKIAIQTKLGEDELEQREILRLLRPQGTQMSVKRRPQRPVNPSQGPTRR
ncbi:FtsW/RodA/SpoVE family cell cycle protein [Ligilactobacillus equi]|uniref:Probable peptidoglycan glycosyltransferase FtsW n=1 Tax=Ligilactobacillus equi DPC 6820 TaxID=1392007 RepID=V7I0V0_9LACO|nr:FtsW/RodA/SpoVE family cell cycle protein [Ligilactobacillus equi]ETA74876.1 cell cycle protein, FtsW/RodA/SpoVE family [Ligilactobacillus equi DPC 6820]